MKSAALCLALLALALGACSKKAAEPEVAPPPAPAQSPQKTVFDTQLKSLQKAKDVQKTVDQQKAELDRQLKDEGG
jgi:hypothetical protein